MVKYKTINRSTMGIEHKAFEYDQHLWDETFNGTKVVAHWHGLRGYTFTFPQVDPHLDDLDPIDPVILIGHGPEAYKKVCDYVRQFAQTMANPDEVCRNTGIYAKTLEREDSMEANASDVRSRVRKTTNKPRKAK